MILTLRVRTGRKAREEIVGGLIEAGIDVPLVGPYHVYAHVETDKPERGAPRLLAALKKHHGTDFGLADSADVPPIEGPAGITIVEEGAAAHWMFHTGRTMRLPGAAPEASAAARYGERQRTP